MDICCAFVGMYNKVYSYFGLGRLEIKKKNSFFLTERQGVVINTHESYPEYIWFESRLRYLS
jgi:hypothetical protein